MYTLRSCNVRVSRNIDLMICKYMNLLNNKDSNRNRSEETTDMVWTCQVPMHMTWV